MGKKDRFQIIYTQGIATTFQVVLDTETGILYLQANAGYGGGITPLLDADGKPARWLTSPEEQP